MAVIRQNGLERFAARAGDALRRLAPRLAGRSGKFAASAAPAVEIALSAGIGFVLLLICYALFAPLPTSRSLPTAPAPDTVAAAPGAVGNPFRTVDAAAGPAVIEQGPALAETSLDLALHGTAQDEAGAWRALIKTPEGEQEWFSIGDEIWDGVRLDRILPNQVVIISGGVRESLSLVNRDLAVTSSSASRSSGAAQPFALGDVVQFVPDLSGGTLNLTLQPGSDRARFEAFGLRSGDVLVSVNNKRVGPEIASELERLRGLAGAAAISIQVERDGVIVPIEVDLAAQTSRE